MRKVAENEWLGTKPEEGKVQFCLVGWAACSLAQSPCGHSSPSSKKAMAAKRQCDWSGAGGGTMRIKKKREHDEEPHRHQYRKNCF